MAAQVESEGPTSEAEPIGLLTEGTTRIAVVVFAVVALAGISAGPGFDCGDRNRRRLDGSGLQQPGLACGH
jgi:hypothetical protein